MSNKVTFGKSGGGPREGMASSESYIMLDGQPVGVITSHYDALHLWDPPSKHRVVSVAASLWGDVDVTFEVDVYKGKGWGIGGYSHYNKVRSVQSARAEVKRWVRGHLENRGE